MNKGIILVISVLLAVFAHANLVVNGSFETGPEGVFVMPANDVMTGWRMFDTTLSAVTYELVNDAAGATDGSNYVKITSTSTNAAGIDAGLDITQAGAGAVPVAIGVTYTVSFDAKKVAGTDNNLVLSIKTFEGNSNVESLVVTNVSLTSEWATYTYEVTPTLLESGGLEPNIYIGFRPKAGASLLDETIYMDNISVVEEPNVLGNASFETGTVGVYPAANLPEVNSGIPGWRMFDTTFSAVTYELVNDVAEATDGSNYVKITSTSTNAAGIDAGLDLWQSKGINVMKVSTGVTYTVSFDAKRVAGADNSLLFTVKTLEGTSIVEVLASTNFLLTSGWATYTYEVTPTLLESGGLEPNIYIGFRPKAGASLLDETIYIDNILVFDPLALVEGSYEYWLNLYPTLGSSTNYVDDPDIDGMDNLLEYALGGVPTNSDAALVLPTSAREGGWMYYVYKQRKNYASFGLNYSVFSGNDLVFSQITNATSVIGSGEYDADFNLATNGIQTALETAAFMQLKVQKTD